jgi:hypothetical protein
MHEWFYSSVIVGVWLTALALITLNIVGAWLYFRRNPGWGWTWDWPWVGFGWGDDDADYGHTDDDDDYDDDDGDGGGVAAAHFPFGDPLDRFLTDDDGADVDDDSAPARHGGSVPTARGSTRDASGTGDRGLVDPVQAATVVADPLVVPDDAGAPLQGGGGAGIRRRPLPQEHDRSTKA